MALKFTDADNPDLCLRGDAVQLSINNTRGGAAESPNLVMRSHAVKRFSTTPSLHLDRSGPVQMFSLQFP